MTSHDLGKTRGSVLVECIGLRLGRVATEREDDLFDTVAMEIAVNGYTSVWLEMCKVLLEMVNRGEELLNGVAPLPVEVPPIQTHASVAVDVSVHKDIIPSEDHSASAWTCEVVQHPLHHPTAIGLTRLDSCR